MTTAKGDKWDLFAWGILACFVIESGFNALGGYEFVGGGGKGMFVGLGGLVIAGCGVWCGQHGASLLLQRRLVPVGWVLMAVATLVFLASQWTAWRVLGVTFQDGALRREMASGDLESWRSERRNLGTPRPLTAIENDLNLELRNTSRQYPNGDGPKALKLKNEKVIAERAAELEGLIGKARDGGTAVKAGAENTIAGKIGFTAEQNLTISIVVFTFLIGFFANFGLALREVVSGRAPHGGGGDDDGGEPSLEERAAMVRNYARERRANYDRRAVMAPQQHAMLPAPAASAAPNHQGVTINIGGERVEVDGAPAPARALRPVVVPPGVRGARRPRHDLDALPADGPPVDRSQVARVLTDAERPAADVILAFRAACVADAPGGLVSLDRLYKRYEHWAGERALDRRAFADLFSDMTGVRLVDLGGFLHAQDVALRMGAALKVAV